MLDNFCQRRKESQLAMNRIQLRFEMERPFASNDAFLGRNELMRVSALLRTVMYVKAYMLLYKVDILKSRLYSDLIQERY